MSCKQYLVEDLKMLFYLFRCYCCCFSTKTGVNTFRSLWKRNIFTLLQFVRIKRKAECLIKGFILAKLVSKFTKMGRKMILEKPRPPHSPVGQTIVSTWDNSLPVLMQHFIAYFQVARFMFC